ncbi:MAG: 6-hydroxymethylpterin diphosphokinase MptE-like protein [Haloarculaceae archaeon]
MRFDEWEPVYEAILADFGFDRRGDERARDVLAGLVGDAATLSPADLDFTGETVAIAGAGPSLASSVDRATSADSVVAASDAAAVLREHGVEPTAYVTDLDAETELAAELSAAGAPVAVHAHGDNVPALREQVPALAFESVLPTTQAAPAAPVYNPGGFTDGDRAAFLADHCGATDLTFLGWDFDAPDAGSTKRRKLRWAERLLRWLERRRGERFAVLDGRRDAIDESPLPDG